MPTSTQFILASSLRAKANHPGIPDTERLNVKRRFRVKEGLHNVKNSMVCVGAQVCHRIQVYIGNVVVISLLNAIV